MEPNADVRGVGDVDFTSPPTIAVSTGHFRAEAPEPRAVDVELITVTSTFDAFYRSNRTPIARALALTLRDVDLATEATDEALARAYQRWNQVEHLDNPAGWVYRVGLNWGRSIIRRVTRPAPAWVTAPATTAEPSWRDPAIDRALGELSIDHRSVVICRLLLGYSEEQTATLLGIRPGTVKSRLSRATGRLSVSLAPLAPARSARPPGQQVRTTNPITASTSPNVQHPDEETLR